MNTENNYAWSVSNYDARTEREMAYRLTCISSYVASIAADATDETVQESWRQVALTRRLHNHLYNIEKLQEGVLVQEAVRCISLWVRNRDKEVRCNETARHALQLANALLSRLAEQAKLIAA